jgi:hypothetical protein
MVEGILSFDGQPKQRNVVPRRIMRESQMRRESVPQLSIGVMQGIGTISAKLQRWQATGSLSLSDGSINPGDFGLLNEGADLRYLITCSQILHLPHFELLSRDVDGIGRRSTSN